MVLGIMERGWSGLRVMPLGGWNPFYSPSRHLHVVVAAYGKQFTDGFASGIKKAQEREREIGRLPEPERSAVREAELLAAAERAGRHAAEHLARVPWFANPRVAYSSEEDEED